MGDNHVCSFCNTNLVGKQHVKIVFENWPVDEQITYRRRGQEVKRTRKVTKEVITCFGMECLDNPERWKNYGIDPVKVRDFFENLRFAGKNPIFRARVEGKIDNCLAFDCAHRNIVEGQCVHLIRGNFPYTGLDGLSCTIGHPGIVLVRQKKGTTSSTSWKSFRLWWQRTPHKSMVGLLMLPFVFLWFCLWPIFVLVWACKRLSLTDLIRARCST